MVDSIDDIQLKVLNDITPKILDFLKTQISNYKDTDSDVNKNMLKEFADASIAKMDKDIVNPDIIYKKMYVDVDQSFREFCEYSGIPISDFTAVNFEKPVEKIKIAEKIDQPVVINADENELFFPFFGLLRNPFQYSDAGHEIFSNESDDSSKYPVIQTSASREVLMKAISGVDTIFIGEKGIGKSVMGILVKEELSRRDKKIFTVIAPETFTSFYLKLFAEIMVGRIIELHEISKYIEQEMIGQNYMAEPMIKSRNFDGTISRNYPLICSHPKCPHLPKCALTLADGSAKFFLANLFYPEKNIKNKLPTDIICPLYQWLIVKISGALRIEGTFFLDYPDDMGGWLRYFKEFIADFRRNNTLIIMVTREQFDTFNKNEFIGRFPNQVLKSLSNEEIKEIILSRIKTDSEPEGEYPPVFTEDGLNYLVVQTKGNPRKAIQYGARVLEVMLVEDKKESADMEFVISSLKDRIPVVMSIADALTSLVRELKEKKAGWVTGSEINRMLVEEYNILTLSPVSLGKRLKKMGIENIYRPLTSYWFGT